MLGVDASSPYTLSGLFVIGAALAFALNRLVLSSALLIMAGSGGFAVAWDRWSARTGEQVHLTALFNPTAPSVEEATLFATHVPLLVIGLLMLAVSVRRSNRP